MDALSAISQTLQAVLESLADGVWVLDPAGKTIYANQASANLLQVERPHLAQANLQDYVIQVTRQRSESVRPGARTQRDIAVIVGDQVTWVRLTVIPRFSHAGHLDGHIVMLARTVEPDELPADNSATNGTSPQSKTVHLADGGPHSLLCQLSPRERLVAEELLNGNRVPAIARHLSVAPSTVRNQLAGAFRKLGVHSQQGLIDLLRGPLPDTGWAT